MSVLYLLPAVVHNVFTVNNSGQSNIAAFSAGMINGIRSRVVKDRGRVKPALEIDTGRPLVSDK